MTASIGRSYHSLTALTAAFAFACARAPVQSGPAAQSSPNGQLPCAVQNLLASKCGSCHGHPTQNTAPMSLTSLQELHALAPERKAEPARVYERVLSRIRDARSPMPPRGQPPLSEAELSLLELWLQNGALAGEACGDPASEHAPDPDALVRVAGGAAGTAPVPGNSAAPAAVSSKSSPPPSAPAAAGSGARAETPADSAGAPADPADCEYVDITARNDASGTPFRVPADAQDLYRCFLIDLDLKQPTQALSFAPINDNLAVMHHWLLYSMESFGSREAVVDCDYPRGYRMIAGGAASTAAWSLPNDVGMQIGRGLFMLEVHYNNIAKPETTDRSGVRVCTTRQLRANTATVSWLGVESFIVPPKAADYEVSNGCKPKRSGPIHLLRYWPHMHTLGARARMRVSHQDGRSEDIYDATYSFDAQASYAIPYVLQPGDTVTTSCWFDNPNAYPVAAGLKTSDEMCNHFVIAYPAEALTSDNPSAWNVACVGPP